jgi:hypothetical protein
LASSTSSGSVQEGVFIVPKAAGAATGTWASVRLEKQGLRSASSTRFKIQEIADYVNVEHGPGWLAGVVYQVDDGEVIGPGDGRVLFLWGKRPDIGCTARRSDCAFAVPVECDGLYRYRPEYLDGFSCVAFDSEVLQVANIPSIDHEPIRGAWEVIFLASTAHVSNRTVVQYVGIDPNGSTAIWDPYDCAAGDDDCDFSGIHVAGLTGVLQEPVEPSPEERIPEHPLVLVNGWTERPDSYDALSRNFREVQRAAPFAPTRIRRSSWLLNYHGYRTPASDAGRVVAYGLDLLLRKLLVGGTANGLATPDATGTADVVAHSFGAMAVRAYVQGLTGSGSGFRSDPILYRQDIHRLVLLTPVNHGSHAANRVLEGGTLQDILLTYIKCTFRATRCQETWGSRASINLR